MPLAEGPSISGGALVAILLVLLVMFALWCAAVVFGFIWARRAGHGDERSRVLWVGAGVVVLLPGIFGTVNPLIVPALAILAAQFAVFAAARR